MSSFVAGKLFVSKAIKSSKVLAFPELGMEDIYQFEVVDMSVTMQFRCGYKPRKEVLLSEEHIRCLFQLQALPSSEL